MLHYSPAKKNKHQNDHETISRLYLYEEHKSPKNLSKHLSAETKAQLGDNISSMRRHFKYTVKKLRSSLNYGDLLKDKAEKDAFDAYARLHPHHA